MENFSLEKYLTNGVKKIIAGICKASIKNPSASIFMMKYIKVNAEANQIRKNAEQNGEHIPPFLIASITTKCNLHCKGCYARANHNCFDETSSTNTVLDAKEWGNIFDQAEELGISFILLAGGEPMLRTDVLAMAGSHRKILFPIFTNGTLLTDDGIKLLTKNPNLLPVLSIEGDKNTTDMRRGEGVYNRLLNSMNTLHNKGIIFGASVTVQKNNMSEVMGDTFISTLSDKGCKAVVYVEYVPVNPETTSLAPDDEDREYITKRLSTLRNDYPEMIFISFPGDEKTSGGCLAAGRGFFHINAYGSAEPCPFSAYSDTTLRDVSLKEALNSPLFKYLKDSGTLNDNHVGGCVLFEHEDKVKEFCNK